MKILDSKKVICDNGAIRYCEKCFRPELDGLGTLKKPVELIPTILFIVENNSCELISQKDGNIISNELLPFDICGPGVFLVKNKNTKLIGAIDNNGKQLIPCKYSDAKITPIGIIVKNSNGKFGFLSKDGRLLIPFHYDKIHYPNYMCDFFWISSDKSDDHLFDLQVTIDGKTGVLNCKDTIKEVLPIKFLDVRLVHDFFIVHTASGYGTFNRDGKELIPPEYESIDYGISDYYYNEKNLIEVIVKKDNEYQRRNAKTGKVIEEHIHQIKVKTRSTYDPKSTLNIKKDYYEKS